MYIFICIWGLVRGVKRKGATCIKWKWTKYRCKHTRVSIYDGQLHIPRKITPLVGSRFIDDTLASTLEFTISHYPPLYYTSCIYTYIYIKTFSNVYTDRENSNSTFRRRLALVYTAVTRSELARPATISTCWVYRSLADIRHEIHEISYKPLFLPVDFPSIALHICPMLYMSM